MDDGAAGDDSQGHQLDLHDRLAHDLPLYRYCSCWASVARLVARNSEHWWVKEFAARIRAGA